MACNIFLESRTEHRWLKWIALEDIGRYEDKTIRSSKSDPWRAAILELFAQDAVPAQAARRWWTSKRRKPSRSDAPAGIKMSESSCLRHQSHDVPVGFSLSCKFRASLWSCNRDGCFYLSASRLFPKAQCGNCHFNLRCKCGMVWSGLHALDQFNFQLIPCDTWSFFMQFFGVLCVHSSVWGHAGSTVMSRHSYTVGCEMPPTRAAFPARCVQEDYRDVRCVISRIVQVQVELENDKINKYAHDAREILMRLWGHGIPASESTRAKLGLFLLDSNKWCQTISLRQSVLSKAWIRSRCSRWFIKKPPQSNGQRRACLCL